MKDRLILLVPYVINGILEVPIGSFTICIYLHRIATLKGPKVNLLHLSVLLQLQYVVTIYVAYIRWNR